MTGHLNDETLALLAGNDLGMIETWRANRHIAHCQICRMALDEFKAARTDLEEAANELPPGVNWTHLSREMHGNIHVGLEAAECVAPAPYSSEPLGWRATIAFASLVTVVVVGWYLSVPRFVPRPLASVASDSAVVEATPAGVELKQGAQGFTLLNPRANHVTYSVDTTGARAQYVDTETGQVTISHVSLD